MEQLTTRIGIEPGLGLVGRFGDTVIVIPRGGAATRPDDVAHELLELAAEVGSDRQAPATRIAGTPGAEPGFAEPQVGSPEPRAGFPEPRGGLPEPGFGERGAGLAEPAAGFADAVSASRAEPVGPAVGGDVGGFAWPSSGEAARPAEDRSQEPWALRAEPSDIEPEPADREPESPDRQREPADREPEPADHQP